MPRKRVSRRKNVRRRTTRRRTKTISKGLQPFPSRHIVHMKYSQQIRITTAALDGQYNFNLNSIHDPDQSGLGHQPYSSDTWSTIYNRYRVIACRYYIKAYSALNKTANFAILPANEIISATSVDQIKENPRARSGILAPITAGNPQTFTGKVYMPALTGRTKAQYTADDRYQAAFGSSPAEQMILNLYCENPDGTLVPDVYASVVLTYIVELFDPKILPQS